MREVPNSHAEPSHPWVITIALVVLVSASLVSAFIVGQMSAHRRQEASDESTSEQGPAVAHQPQTPPPALLERRQQSENPSSRQVVRITYPTRPISPPALEPPRRSSKIEVKEVAAIAGPPGMSYPPGWNGAPSTNHVWIAARPLLPGEGSADASVEGTVRIVGEIPDPKPFDSINNSPECAAHLGETKAYTRGFRVTPSGYAADVLVQLESENTTSASEQFGPNLVEMRFDGCVLWPYTAAIKLGDTVRIENDDIATLLISDLVSTQIPGGGSVEVKPSKPNLFMEIRDARHGSISYLSVLNHSFFSITDTNGNFSIPAGASDGVYTLTAKHRIAGEKSARIELHRSRRQAFDLTLSYRPKAGVVSNPPTPRP